MFGSHSLFVRYSDFIRLTNYFLNVNRMGLISILIFLFVDVLFLNWRSFVQSRKNDFLINELAGLKIKAAQLQISDNLNWKSFKTEKPKEGQLILVDGPGWDEPQTRQLDAFSLTQNWDEYYWRPYDNYNS